MKDSAIPDPLALVRAYHERTKHRLGQYARALGYMDWATQPSPFRTYEGAERLALDHPPLDAAPTYDQLFAAEDLPRLPIARTAISRLFYDSLALSAWKQAPGTRPWSLRINPSSGALHPTEGYLIAGPVPGLSETAGVYHYAPYWHALERRLAFDAAEWDELTAGLPQPCVLVALTSIYWRESWKYGERAFRYCHHDVGHAIGTVALAARTLGWRARLISVAADDLELLVGVHEQQGAEAEHGDCLLVLTPASDRAIAPNFRLASAQRERWRQHAFQGQPNRLSKDHHAWPIIDDVAAATRARLPEGEAPGARVAPARPPEVERHLSAQQIIRQRRSAVNMDGQTSIAREQFYHMLSRVLPARIPCDVLPWQPCVALGLFVHRARDVEPGLYLLLRDPAQRDSLRAHIRADAEWQKPDRCPADLELYRLIAGDARRVAKLVSCQQDIAADGAFAVAMLCEFDARLERAGPSFYPRLFWEAGRIGQVLYLEAEAAGIRATGIGCFFDDATHQYLGLASHAWQDLYHFTLGGPIDDPRLQTIAPYAHLP